jgi:hypothetical protein
MLIWKVPLSAPPNLVVRVFAPSSTALTFKYLTYELSVVLVALTVKSSLFSVNGKPASRVKVMSVFKTGEADDGVMAVAGITLFFVVREFE